MPGAVGERDVQTMRYAATPLTTGSAAEHVDMLTVQGDSRSLCIHRGTLCSWGLVPSWTKKGTKPDHFRMVRRQHMA